MNKLLRVADICDKVDPEKFSLRDWDYNGCRCAVGHAMNDSWFNERGFHSTDDNCLRQAPLFGNLRQWTAIVAFFEITIDEAEFLFVEDSYVSSSPKEVAIRIRLFVEQREKKLTHKELTEKVRELEHV